MSDERRTTDLEHGLAPGDAELVRRIAAEYRPSPASASARVAFRAGIDARVQRRSARRIWWLGLATASALALFALVRTAPVVPTAVPSDPDGGEALLALASATDEEEALPADYQAIEDLFLEGEGV